MKHVAFAWIASGCLAISAGAALAQASSGNDQLAREIGVQSGVYSTAELIRMRTALEDGKMTEFRAIRDRMRVGVATKSDPSAVRVALGQKLAVDPHSLTIHEMHLLSGAKATRQTGPVAAFWRNKDPQNPSRRASHVSQGEARLAADLGVDPRDHTLAELVRMKVDVDTN